MTECVVIVIITIIIIKAGEAERKRSTPYQSEDPSPSIPTYRQNEEKGENNRRV